VGYIAAGRGGVFNFEREPMNAREVLAMVLMLPDEERQKVIAAALSMDSALAVELMEYEQQSERQESRRYTLKEAREIESAFKMDVEQYGYLTQTTRQKLMTRFDRTGDAIDNMFWVYQKDRKKWDERMKNRQRGGL